MSSTCYEIVIPSSSPKPILGRVESAAKDVPSESLNVVYVIQGVLCTCVAHSGADLAPGALEHGTLAGRLRHWVPHA